MGVLKDFVDNAFDALETVQDRVLDWFEKED
jgi:hypothetical protein